MKNYLYLVTEIGSLRKLYVIADDPTSAIQQIQNKFQYYSEFKMQTIEVIAENGDLNFNVFEID